MTAATVKISGELVAELLSGGVAQPCRIISDALPKGAQLVGAKVDPTDHTLHLVFEHLELTKSEYAPAYQRTKDRLEDWLR